MSGILTPLLGPFGFQVLIMIPKMAAILFLVSVVVLTIIGEKRGLSGGVLTAGGALISVFLYCIVSQETVFICPLTDHAWQLVQASTASDAAAVGQDFSDQYVGTVMERTLFVFSPLAVALFVVASLVCKKVLEVTSKWSLKEQAQWKGLALLLWAIFFAHSFALSEYMGTVPSVLAVQIRALV
jgi:hypothetical protein